MAKAYDQTFKNKIIKERLSGLSVKSISIKHGVSVSVTGKAVSCSLKNKVELMTYLSDGHIPIDNNLDERGIKPFVINRKNFLFSNTEKGAEASSMYMSIIQTAKTNGLDTNKYLAYLFENLYKIQIFESDYQDPVKLDDKFKIMAHLLPWDDNIKTQFKMKETSR
ncbi:Transposase, putative fragment [Paracholeplasma brassicae]|uniref:Transposase, putative n=1 Tax=Acholeplasma brassicae TaxID=61635 RepID=U4KSU6_9MOLU|nr:transposase [Paracholeplasma brassicae]CCV65554.1 Transposase, putative fragment [Paracholeplasma brassicae]